MSHTQPEILEARIAPASVLVYTDLDGDLVKISASTGDLTGKASFIGGGDGGRLETLDLSGKGFYGADIAITVTKAGDGDGRVGVDHIEGGKNDFGIISIQGDLGDIDAGSGQKGTTAIQLLKVKSMGRIGLALQNHTGDLESDLSGRLGALAVTGSIKEAYLNVSRGIGSIVIGGSLLGGSADNSGSIASGGSIGTVFIGHDIVGGGGFSSGKVLAGGYLVSSKISGSIIGGSGRFSGGVGGSRGIEGITVGGSVVGGWGQYSGFISASYRTLADCTVRGSVVGGSGFKSGAIDASHIENLHLGKDLRGGDGEYSGQVYGGRMDSVTISGSIVGGEGDQSGVVDAQGNIEFIRIGGDVKGGGGHYSGMIETSHKLISCIISGSLIGKSSHTGIVSSVDDMESIVIGHDVRGGYAYYSGQITTGVKSTGSDYGELGHKGDLLSCTISGSIIGGDGDHSGAVSSYGTIANVKIRHDVVGGSGKSSGSIHGGSRTYGSYYQGDKLFAGNLISCTISGSLVGGFGKWSGSVYAVSAATDLYAPVKGGRVGEIHIGQNVQGGAGVNSGRIANDYGKALKVCTISGSLIGGAGDDSGTIYAGGVTDLIKIGQNVQGGTGVGSGSISASTLKICKIGGSLVGGNSSYTGEVSAFEIGEMKIGRDLQGGSTLYQGPDVVKAGCIVSASLNRLVIGGSVIAGEDASNTGNLVGSASILADEKIGSVTIRGDVENPGALYGSPDSIPPAVTISAGGAYEFIRPDDPSKIFIFPLPGPAIGKLVIKGNATGLNVLAGYDPSGVATNGGAKIGVIRVGGDLVASNIIAGVKDGGNMGFGDAGDTIITEEIYGGGTPGPGKIGHISIGGAVLGTATTGDQFGIEAQQIGSLKIHGALVALAEPVSLAPGTGDVTVRLISP